MEQILDLYEKIWINDSHCQEKNYNTDQRLIYHKENSLPVMEKIKKWCQDYTQSSEYEEHSALGKACAYLIKHYTELIRFCEAAFAPIDNNKMEEGLKVPIRTRKSAYFYKTKVGADVSNRLISLICTAHRNDVNAFHYLNALQRNKTELKNDPSQWMPWNVKDDFLCK